MKNKLNSFFYTGLAVVLIPVLILTSSLVIIINNANQNTEYQYLNKIQKPVNVDVAVQHGNIPEQNQADDLIIERIIPDTIIWHNTPDVKPMQVKAPPVSPPPYVDDYPEHSNKPDSVKVTQQDSLSID
jgi:hypothetical protein